MAIDDITKKKIENKAKLFADKGKRITTRITEEIDAIIKRLEETKKELIEEVEIEFSKNIYAELLQSINSGNCPTDDEIKSILTKEIPNNFGPIEDSFNLIYKEIDSLRLRKEKEKKKEEKIMINPFDLIPKNVKMLSSSYNSISICWDKVDYDCYYEIELESSLLQKTYQTPKNDHTLSWLDSEVEYKIRVRTIVFEKCVKSIWSDPIAVRTTPKPYGGVWKKYPMNYDENKKYSVDVKNSRIATNDGNCTIIGNELLPFNKITPWNIRILKSKDNNGSDIFIGAAPFNINQNDNYNCNKCGWYLHCFYLALFSGPPHCYNHEEYGPRKGKDGQYVHTGDSIGVVMDTTHGELSFVLGEVNLGVAYEGIPLDKPLVPCVILGHKGDSVELDIYEVKENTDSSIPIPSNVTIKSITWDSISLTWDAVKGVSFYQIEIDGKNTGDAPTSNTFIKGGLFPETEYNFRIRTVRENLVSEWSDVVEGRTLKAPDFKGCVWKECPDYVYEKMKYSVDKYNSRIATSNIDDRLCTIIGNTLLRRMEVASWSIKILKSHKGSGIYIGVAPVDINQNVDYNYEKCGWYFSCYYSALWSGPPHNYNRKAYGPYKGLMGRGDYVHTGDSVGVVMDTAKGSLSFVLNGVNRGVAYESIPLDKPLVPCVILIKQGLSVELLI